MSWLCLQCMMTLSVCISFQLWFSLVYAGVEPIDQYRNSILAFEPAIFHKDTH